MKSDFSPSPLCKCNDVLNEALSNISFFDDQFSLLERKKIEQLRERFSEGRFNLAVLGQFKRGKSTLLNAIIGMDILPSSVVPLTAIPTFLISGNSFKIRVVFESDKKSDEILEVEGISDLKKKLSKFVTEQENPENKMGVSSVYVYIPDNPVLEHGLVLIDTPGIGSTFTHNTEATLNFLPQCDAALFVISADPPITQIEIEFLRDVSRKVPELFFVLNKKDYLDEYELSEVMDFLKKHLSEIGIGKDAMIFSVSAKQGLKGKLKNDPNMIKLSGIFDVERHVLNFLVKRKHDFLAKAVALKLRSSIESILLNLEIKLRSLELPLNILEERKRIFEKKIEEIRLVKQSSVDILEGDNKRLHLLLEEFSTKLREESFDYFYSILGQEMSLLEGGLIDEKRIRQGLKKVIPQFFEKKMGEAVDFFGKKVESVLDKHKTKAIEIADSLRRVASELFEVDYFKEVDDSLFKLANEPYWVTHRWNTTFSPIPSGAIDRFLPVKARRKRIEKRLKDDIRSLIVANVENLRWSIFQSINQSFRQFKTFLEDRFEVTLSATYGAIDKVVENRRQEKVKVDEEVKRLKKVQSKLNSILYYLNNFLYSIKNQ